MQAKKDILMRAGLTKISFSGLNITFSKEVPIDEADWEIYPC